MSHQNERCPRSNPASGGSSGFSLVEVLVAITIVAIVAALLTTVLIAGKERSKVAVDLSNLRQLGLAGSMYASDRDDAYPLSVRPLVRLDPSLERICASPSDTAEIGLMRTFINELTLASKMIPDDGTRCTYIGPADGLWTWESYRRKIADGRNPGWLVNLARSKPHRGRVVASLGVYQRLLLDGSVQTRTRGFQGLWIEAQFEPRVLVFGMLFCDEDASWFEGR